MNDGSFIVKGINATSHAWEQSCDRQPTVALSANYRFQLPGAKAGEGARRTTECTEGKASQTEPKLGEQAVATGRALIRITAPSRSRLRRTRQDAAFIVALR
jgi:hypothetical protein